MFDFASYIIFDVKFIWKICFKLLPKFNHAKGHNETLDFVLVDVSVSRYMYIHIFLFVDGHNETFDFAIRIDVL